MEDNTQEPPKPPDLELLRREMDWVQAQVFLGNNAAFYGCIMAGLNFTWTSDIPTAQTNGIYLWWNPEYFLKLPRETRKTMLVHELMHPAKLHFLRRGDRHPRVWNFATDTAINLELESQGFTFEGWSAWKDPKYKGWIEEDIYDDMMTKFETGDLNIPRGWNQESDNEDDDVDMLEPEEEEQREIINRIIIANEVARNAGEGGLGEGQVSLILNQFLSPVVPWEIHLNHWMQDLQESRISWSRPNRRIQHLYLPTRQDDDGRLEHLMYFLDVSGSISDGHVVRFNSELFYVKRRFNPKKLTIVQFDNGIRKIDVIDEADHFDKIEVIGRGGTSWGPVKAYIEEHKPTAAIIFTDMGFADPITPLEVDIPVLWVALGCEGMPAPFGKITYIRG